MAKDSCKRKVPWSYFENFIQNNLNDNLPKCNIKDPNNKKYIKHLKRKQIAAYRKLIRSQDNNKLDNLLSHNPTPYLYIMGPLSLSVQGITYEYFETLLKKYGKIRLLNMGLTRNYIFMSYEDVNSAIKFRNAMHCNRLPNLNGYCIFVDYALEEEEPLFTTKLTKNLATPPLISVDKLQDFNWQWSNENILHNNDNQKPIISNTGKIPGLLLVPDIITKDEEDCILTLLDKSTFDIYHNRHVIHINKNDEKGIPKELNFLIERLASLLPSASTIDYSDINAYRHNHKGILKHHIISNLSSIYKDQKNSKTISKCSQIISDYLLDKPIINGFTPDQIHINKYLKGHGIPPHVDVHSAFSDLVLSLSLKSSLVMEFRKCPSRFDIGKKDKLIEQHDILLPPRSMVILSGPARYIWSHGIPVRLNDHVDGKILPRSERISLTFRMVLKKLTVNVNILAFAIIQLI